MNSILLLGAALAGLPILLHLIMKQEPKRLPFPAFRFLKQKQRINQRKMRLRHFLLLALRVILIALFAATLYQPTLLSENLNISGDQPIAAAIIIDTSPSMGYLVNDKSRLEEARIRALELIDELPDGSRIAILETGEPGGEWLRSRDDARTRLKKLEKPSGVSLPLTSSISHAFGLFKTVDQESDSTDPLPRLVAIFTDRAAACWDPGQTDNLKKLRDADPDRKPAMAVVDVGSDSPVNVSIASVEMKPQLLPANVPALISVAVGSLGADVEAGLICKLDGGAPLRKTVPIPAGQSRGLGFEFKDLTPGLHQIEVKLETPDKLMFDNTRYFTFRVSEPRRILTIADDVKDARFWDLAHEAKGDFTSDTMTPEQAVAADWRKFEAVVVLSVANPNQPEGNPLWSKLLKFAQGGGKVILMPIGDDRLVLDAYDPTKPTADEAANKLMPAALKSVIEARGGVTWALDGRTLEHPMLIDFKAWKQQGNIDVIQNPRRTRKYWDVELLPGSRVIVRYDDDPDNTKRHPAVIERDVGKGKVILLTTRMDVPWDKEQTWHDYWETVGSSWYVVFPNILMTYLTGRTEDANFNNLTSQSVAVNLNTLGSKVDRLVLEGPGLVTQEETYVRLDENQKEVRFGPQRTTTPGNFLLNVEEKDATGIVRLRAIDGFSLNVPADESVMEKVPAAAIEELTGSNSILAVGKNLKLGDVIRDTLPQPVDLFPWLLIGVLLLLAMESVVANRFYRVRRSS